MKKVFVTLMLLAGLSFAANAQQTEKPQLSKEEKAKLKQKQEDELNAAFKEVGLTEEQIKQYKEVTAEANKKSNAVKADATLTDEQKEAKRKEINSEKNDKLKEIMGADKYKQFNAIRKKQKEAAAAVAPKE